jgi:hypothetical protein
MTEDKIKNLLQKADETAGVPAQVSINLSVVRRRVNRRRFINIATSIAAAAVILGIIGLWGPASKTNEQIQQQQKISSLEMQIKQLKARADATYNLVQEVLDDRRQRRLDELQAELASIGDPIEEIKKQVDNTAFILVYQADRMYRELNLRDDAIKTYNRIIKLFPENQWADVARQRLSEIQKNKYKKDSKGDLLWKPQNVPSSC